MTSESHHLVTVWNPSYASDAMDEHLAVLIDWAGRAQAGEADPDEVYVWWGKIRSPNREGLLPHADAVTALDEQIRAGTETHLYLTDYRSLYVAWVGEITGEHLRNTRYHDRPVSLYGGMVELPHCLGRMRRCWGRRRRGGG